DPVEIEVKLDSEYMLESYLVAIPYRASQQARNLRGWSLSAGEELISEVENMNWVAQGAAVIIPVEPTSASASYKLTIPNAQAYQPHMAAFQLYGTEATGVEKMEINAVAKVAGLKGAVAFEGEAGASFGIYTANGVKVGAGIVAAGTNNVALSAGLYIVRIGDKAVKVVVK
ncbi:MAG: T9SS type A sorting domain-containing protein, partial [Muribaculaceae bacterium]|nr:T9SS type A sorting domain-containing protein [Muribaculaceae bacterium]